MACTIHAHACSPPSPSPYIYYIYTSIYSLPTNHPSPPQPPPSRPKKTTTTQKLPVSLRSSLRLQGRPLERVFLRRRPRRHHRVAGTCIHIQCVYSYYFYYISSDIGPTMILYVRNLYEYQAWISNLITAFFSTYLTPRYPLVKPVVL